MEWYLSLASSSLVTYKIFKIVQIFKYLLHLCANFKILFLVSLPPNIIVDININIILNSFLLARFKKKKK